MDEHLIGSARIAADGMAELARGAADGGAAGGIVAPTATSAAEERYVVLVHEALEGDAATTPRHHPPA